MQDLRHQEEKHRLNESSRTEIDGKYSELLHKYKESKKHLLSTDDLKDQPNSAYKLKVSDCRKILNEVCILLHSSSYI